MASLRVATPDDAPMLAELMERLFRQAFADSNDPVQFDAHCRETFGADIQRRELERPDARVWIAEDDGEAIGYAQVELRVPEAKLWRIYVDASRHGKGVARLLMDTALDAARAAGAERIMLTVWQPNERAIAFYRKYGFEVTGTAPYVLGDEVQTDWVMTRPL